MDWRCGASGSCFAALSSNPSVPTKERKIARKKERKIEKNQIPLPSLQLCDLVLANGI
jgi:hypothetical protein